MLSAIFQHKQKPISAPNQINNNRGREITSKKIKVLFTGGGGAGSEALWCLLEQRYTLYFGDADLQAIDPVIPADRRILLPWASDPKFIEKIGGLCRDLKIDLLIPGVDEELLVLARSAEALAPTRLLLPKADYVEVMLDKLHMVRALSAKKIQVPFTKTLADDFGGFSFPCISKPRCGRGSRDVRELSSISEAISLKTALGPFARQMLMQEKIKGTEYTVQMIADAHGRLCAVVPVRVGMKRGITLRAETEAEPRVAEACCAVHQAISAEGCYNIQLMLTPKGDIFPFEINPRVSTTLCLVVASGIDPIAIFLKENHPKELRQFNSGIKLSRHWKNIIKKGEQS